VCFCGKAFSKVGKGLSGSFWARPFGGIDSVAAGSRGNARHAVTQYETTNPSLLCTNPTSSVEFSRLASVKIACRPKRRCPLLGGAPPDNLDELS